MSFPRTLIVVVVLGSSFASGRAVAADFVCDGLVPLGHKMICSGFEPNWAVELVCADTAMSSNFIDAFSGDGIVSTPGAVSFSTREPWTFATDTGVAGSIAYTLGACRDEGDHVHDFTFSPTAAPGLDGPFFPFCCRIE